MFDKELNFTFTVSPEGNVYIEAEDYAGEYTTWQNIEEGEDIENAISIVSDEDIKQDLEVSYDTDILYTDLMDFDYNEDDMIGSFILNVTFDSDEDPMKDINESCTTKTRSKKALESKEDKILRKPLCFYYLEGRGTKFLVNEDFLLEFAKEDGYDENDDNFSSYLGFLNYHYDKIEKLDEFDLNTYIQL